MGLAVIGPLEQWEVALAVVKRRGLRASFCARRTSPIAGILLAASAAPSVSRESSVGQPFDGTFRRESSISVEDLVRLSAAVSHAPPERTQDGTPAGGLGRPCEVARSRGIENHGQHFGLCQHLGQFGNAGDFDEVDGITDDPLQLDEPTSTTLEEREWTEPDDDRHGDILGRRHIRGVGPEGQ